MPAKIIFRDKISDTRFSDLAEGDWFKFQSRVEVEELLIKMGSPIGLGVHNFTAILITCNGASFVCARQDDLVIPVIPTITVTD